MRLGRRRGGVLPEEQRAALRSLVAAPKFELIPLKNALDAAEALPDGATVTVTASPSHGIESTISSPSSWRPSGTTWCRTCRPT